MIRDVISNATASGDVRDDITPSELADYCIHALQAAGQARSEKAVSRLVTLTLAGLRPEA